jgi:hypothetical protein
MLIELEYFAELDSAPNAFWLSQLIPDHYNKAIWQHLGI